MIEAKIIYSQRGDFVLMKSGNKFIISVLIPNFHPNSHFDVSKHFFLTDKEIKHKDDVDYLNKLAELIRKNWTLFSDREVDNIKIKR